MRLGVLFSGGKDSCYALWNAMQKEDVVCLISLVSKNPESYMFHTPNIHLVGLQAEAMSLPLIQKTTNGRKEDELTDLHAAIEEAKNNFGIEGVVTGAIASVYQAERIQRICDSVGLWCFNPLWLKDQEELLKEIVSSGFKVVISGVFAYPFDEKWLGREINADTVKELVEMRKTFKISPSGEGGEIETTVLDAPFFKKKIQILESEANARHNAGVFNIKKARLAEK